MPKPRVHAFAISLEGYGAGPDQSLENQLGRGGTAIHEWFYSPAHSSACSAKAKGTTGVDKDFAARGFANIGA